MNYAKTFFTGAFPEIWLFLLGALFVLTTTYLPKGLTGMFDEYKKSGRWDNLVVRFRRKERGANS